MTGDNEGDDLPLGFENITREDVDQARYEINELLGRWNNRISFENLALAKRYSEDEMSCCVVFGLANSLGRLFEI